MTGNIARMYQNSACAVLLVMVGYVTADWKADIKAANEQFAEYFKARNFSGVADMYTKDCILMPPGDKLVTGREAALAIFSSLPPLGVDRVVLTTEEVIPNNTTAVERGTLTLYKKEGSIFDVGKYVVLWRRVGGQAKLYTDIWNSDA